MPSSIRLGPDLSRSPRRRNRRGGNVCGRTSGLRVERALLRWQLRNPEDCARGRARRHGRDLRFRAPFCAVRTDVPPHDDDATGHAALRRAADSRHPAASYGLRQRPSTNCSRIESHSVRHVRHHPAIDDGRTRVLRRGCHALRPRPGHPHDPRSRRELPRSYRKHGPRIRAKDARTLDGMVPWLVDSVRVARGGDPGRHHPPTLLLRGDGRHRRCPDDFDPRA